MPLTDEQRVEVAEIVAVAIVESEKRFGHRLHRRTIWNDFIPNVLLALVMIVGGWAIVRHEVATNCHQRNEFRAASRTEIELLLPLTRADSQARPVLEHLRDTVFAPVDC